MLVSCGEGDARERKAVHKYSAQPCARRPKNGQISQFLFRMRRGLVRCLPFPCIPFTTTNRHKANPSPYPFNHLFLCGLFALWFCMLNSFFSTHMPVHRDCYCIPAYSTLLPPHSIYTTYLHIYIGLGVLWVVIVLFK